MLGQSDISAFVEAEMQRVPWDVAEEERGEFDSERSVRRKKEVKGIVVEMKRRREVIVVYITFYKKDDLRNRIMEEDD